MPHLSINSARVVTPERNQGSIASKATGRLS
jgi:hypothetical protein